MSLHKPIHLYQILFALLFSLAGICFADSGRVEQDFNFDWKFHLGDKVENADWKPVRLPHDWSIAQDFTQEQTGCSTGFLPGGIGWYRKDFKLPENWRGERVAIVFEGIYKLSQVWLNGHEIGGRPSGFVSFDLDLTKHAHFGDKPNELLVRVDHSSYLDTRWYCGSGIYRNVHLIKTAPTHIPEWGVWVQTPAISDEKASITITTEISSPTKEPVQITVDLIDPDGKTVASHTQTSAEAKVVTSLSIPQPQRWDITSPRTYQAQVRLERDGKSLDERKTGFGIRTAVFDSNRGFLLNGRQVKLKGVNLHHDAGLVGVAVPKDVWRDRLTKLQSVGVNAIRTAHNPHATDLLSLCDEMGLLVMDEFFDEWKVPKDKSLVFLSDNKAPKDVTHGYSEIFPEWAERDVKDTIRRDRNHPSVVLWSIGNEIEWTYPYYPKSSSLNGDEDYHSKAPDFDPEKVRERMAKLHSGPDELLETARQLSGWVRETDPTRPLTSGLVHPSVGYPTGYADALDVVGFNYRANEYDGAHAMYPDKPIIGTENWGTLAEWEAARSRDFVAGIFIWTGYAYLGEAGPWPRKGLEISLFDYAGFKTPRGHFFECLWKPAPKVWLGTTTASESEYSHTAEGGWIFTERAYEPPAMKWLRRWEWDRVSANWNYKPGESTIVQAYANTEEVELRLNGTSLGRQKMADFKDRIAKWQVPFEAGELELIGLNEGKEVTKDILHTHGPLEKIQLKTDRQTLSANQYDVVRVELQLADAKGFPVVTDDRTVTFEVTGPAGLLGVDNGWEKSVQFNQTNSLQTWQGRALLLLQSKDEVGEITVKARSGDVISPTVQVKIQR